MGLEYVIRYVGVGGVGGVMLLISRGFWNGGYFKSAFETSVTYLRSHSLNRQNPAASATCERLFIRQHSAGRKTAKGHGLSEISKGASFAFDAFLLSLLFGLICRALRKFCKKVAMRVKDETPM